MRVIAGLYRSRQLKSLNSPHLRPTSDRLRETLFNVLAPKIAHTHFLDLFAGTGAVGIEALSRGAQDVLFVENHAPTAKLIRENLQSLEIRGSATVLPMDVLHALEKLKQRHQTQPFAYDFIFLDPPYAALRRIQKGNEFPQPSPLRKRKHHRNRRAHPQIRTPGGISPARTRSRPETRRRRPKLLPPARRQGLIYVCFM